MAAKRFPGLFSPNTRYSTDKGFLEVEIEGFGSYRVNPADSRTLREYAYEAFAEVFEPNSPPQNVEIVNFDPTSKILAVRFVRVQPQAAA